MAGPLAGVWVADKNEGRFRAKDTWHRVSGIQMLSTLMEEDTLIWISVANNKTNGYSGMAALCTAMPSAGFCQCGPP